MDWSPFFISIKTAVTATFITFLLGIYTAHLTTYANRKCSWLLDGIFTLPLVLPPTVVGFFLLVLFGKNGLIGQLLLSMGYTIVFTWTATVIAAVVIAFPLMYRSAKAAFEQVDTNLIFAGRTLGMSEYKIFWKITIPLALPGVVSGGILAFARSLGEFGATLMIAGNIPKVTQTMPIAIYMAIQSGSMKSALIWVILIVVISFLILFFFHYFQAREEKYRKRGQKIEPFH